MEAFSMGEINPPMSPSETSQNNGEHGFAGSIHDRLKGLKQWPGSIVRSASGNSTPSSKGKVKASAGKKGKGPVNGEPDESDGDDEDMADGTLNDGDEDDYVVRTGQLSNPMEEVE